MAVSRLGRRVQETLRGAAVAALAVIGSVDPAAAQQVGVVIDSIAVSGNARLTRESIIRESGLPLGQSLGFRDIQRAIERLYGTGEFDQVLISQATVGLQEVLLVAVTERPILAGWDVVGAERLPERSVRGRVGLNSGRPFDRAQAALAVARIDSLYRNEGYFQTAIDVVERRESEGAVRAIFEIREGSRVAISQIVINGNDSIPDAEVTAAMATKTEGFLWFRRGEYDEPRLQADLRQRLPEFYAARGFIDFRVLRDTLIVDADRGKATLVLDVEEGTRYFVGGFEVVGNRQYSTETVERFYPFGQRTSGFLGLGGVATGPVVFNQTQWESATGALHGLYLDNGYIRAQVNPVMVRRTSGDTSYVDLRWQVFEGTPAIVSRIDIAGNTVTHENVIRRAIVMVPGDVFRRQALIRSYQNVSNLNFFQQPMATPEVLPTPEGDVNVTFRVEERNTGNINFGASVGQGTGLGGFIGLQQPNLFGRGKSASFQWQFGRNVSDFNVSYTDPSVRGILISTSVSLHNTRLRYTIGDLGRIRTRGGSVQVGWPFFGSRFTRIFASYTIEESNYDSETLQPRFNCANCVLSSVGLGVTRDTRVELPFATGGTLHSINLSQTGGALGGSGNFRRATLEGRWYAQLAQLGSPDPTGTSGNPIKVVFGLTGKTGLVWGDAGPHFRQLFSMGGTQFGVPLRGYEEFSITPFGFDPTATGTRADPDAFGGSYFASTVEVGIRFSQSVYVSTFLDAGNVWRSPAQFNPSKLYRGAGVGLSLLTPLGPIGLDYAYGFDRVDGAGNLNPGWKFHFRLGNFF